MSRVIHFEFSSSNPGLSIQFYNTVFGWEVENWDEPEDYWLISTGDEENLGINGAIKQETLGGQPTIVTIDVSSIDETLVRIEKAGGSILIGKEYIPGVGFHAYGRDTEGIIFGILQRDENNSC